MSKIRNTNRKWSNMLSTKYRNHQHMDYTAFQEISYCKRQFQDNSCCGQMQHYDTSFCTPMTYVALQDCISETNREALKRLHISFAEQEDKYKTLEEEIQVTNTYDKVEITSTEYIPKFKKNKRKWLYGLSTGAVLAGVMAYVFKKLVI